MSETLPLHLVGLLLLAALAHAVWNALVKADSDRLCAVGVVCLGGPLLGVPALLLVAPPLPAAWPWLAASAVIHLVYASLLMSAYNTADLSHVYPLARGLGPALVALASGLVLGERLEPRVVLGVGLVSSGVLLLTFGARAGTFTRRGTRRGTQLAVLAGATIATYTIVDGSGARAAGDPLSYVAWHSILAGPWLFFYAWWRRGGKALARYLRGDGRRVVLAGVIATLGYAVAIYCLSVGRMANVAALRETSVLFGALLGALVLGEPFGRRRVLAAAVIVAGLLLMNLRW